MAEIFEINEECAKAVEGFLAETKYEPKHPKLKIILVSIGSAGAWYVVDGILSSLAPTPVKFPIMGAKILRAIGITALGAAITSKVEKALEEEYDQKEKLIYDISEKIKTSMKEDESNEETASE